jgi:16S rRNA processing protein RimM
MKKDELIKLGFVANPHGIKGEAELRLVNQETDESILENGMKIWLFPTSLKSKISPSGEEWEIEKLRFGNKVICQLKGIKDRTHLESLIPFEFFLDRESFPDMDVVNESGDKIGTLESFSHNGMQYLFDVRLINGEKMTLPYVESFFPEIDTENKKITMIMPEYTE